MEPSEFLNAAKSLLQKEEVTEVDYRNAVSRAYYCAFHTCSNLLKKYPPSERQCGAEHEKIIDGLLEHQNKSFHRLGHQLKGAKLRRAKADYRLAEVLTIQDANIVIKSVEKILQEINKI